MSRLNDVPPDNTTAGTLREVAPVDWGKVLLEEILFRAARDVSQDPTAVQPAVVTLEFQVSANPQTGAIEITAPGAVEAAIVTRIAL